jgi:hypothetical protein
MTFDFSDPKKLRLAQDFADLKTRRTLVNVRVRRPTKEEFVMVHPDDSFREGPIGLLTYDREEYFVEPAFAREVQDSMKLIKSCALYTSISSTGQVFLWPLQMPDADGSWNAWHVSRHRCIEIAKTRWLRVWPGVDGYEAKEAEVASAFGEPEWPEDMTLGKLLEIAFGDRIILGMDHPVMLKLRGAIA